MSVARTLGQGLLFNIVVPIVVLSGLATAIFFLSFVFSSEFRWFGFALTLFLGPSAGGVIEFWLACLPKAKNW